MTNIRLRGDIMENERAIHPSASEKIANPRVFFPACGLCLASEQNNDCCEEVFHVFVFACSENTDSEIKQLP